MVQHAPQNAGGQFDGVFSLAQDVTAQRQLAEQVRQAQQRLEHVVSSNPSILFTLKIADDQVRGISWISDNVKAIFGYEPAEAYGRDWWLAHVHPDDRDRARSQVITDLLTQGRTAHEYRFRHRDGAYRWTQGEIRLMRDAEGKAVEAVGSWSDITERKQLEDQFRQAQKMEAIGRLAGGVAHDFNNVLTVINGYGELALGGLPADHPARSLVREMVAAGERASGLTRQLLAFSRKAIIEPRVLNLRALVADLNRMLRRIVGEDVEFTVAADQPVGAVLADPGQIEQVLMNLVVNARDAMPTGGRLTIEVRNATLTEAELPAHSESRPGPYVEVSVADTGSGMDAATMARIFEPFFSTKGERGTGLGLATVHGIIRQAGGHITAASEVGRGTTFRVYLPQNDQAPPGSADRAEPAGMPTGRETILLIEDEGVVRTLTRHVLAECGYTVLEARDGAEAIRLAEQYAGRIDLVVTDVVMPHMGGREAAERLVKLHPGIKVLFLSGYTDDAVVRHGVQKAQVAFLQKPFKSLALAVKVREVLDADRKKA